MFFWFQKVFFYGTLTTFEILCQVWHVRFTHMVILMMHKKAFLGLVEGEKCLYTIVLAYRFHYNTTKCKLNIYCKLFRNFTHMGLIWSGNSCAKLSG